MNDNNTKKSIVTIKMVLRVLSLITLIIVFCPTFLVSCSEQSLDVSVMTVVNGVSMYGEEVVEPHPIAIICLLIPIIMLLLLFIKKFEDRKNAIFVAICSVADIVI